MKKKLLFGLLAIIMCFTLVGCGNDNTKTESDATNTKEETQTSTTNNSNEDEIELYSDSTKIVFQNGNYKLVYYYSGEKITKYEAYIDYESSALANLALASVKKENNVKNAYVKGKYLIVEYADSTLENLTTSEVRAAYSYLQEVQKKN